MYRSNTYINGPYANKFRKCNKNPHIWFGDGLVGAEGFSEN